jgi:hypothetical protein
MVDNGSRMVSELSPIVTICNAVKALISKGKIRRWKQGSRGVKADGARVVPCGAADPSMTGGIAAGQRIALNDNTACGGVGGNVCPGHRRLRAVDWQRGVVQPT